jgi:predicted Rossmann-fold nucleotide-binding protein
VFPGGFGTMDELFEILTLLQTRKAPALPVVLFGRDYWRKIVDFEAMVEDGFIGEQDLSLFELVDEPEEGWNALVRRGLDAHLPSHEIRAEAQAKAAAQPGIS